MTKFGIGQPVRRVEDARFLLGRGRYVDDISLPRQAHGALLSSPHAHARIVRMDASKLQLASKLPVCMQLPASSPGARNVRNPTPPGRCAPRETCPSL